MPFAHRVHKIHAEKPAVLIAVIRAGYKRTSRLNVMMMLERNGDYYAQRSAQTLRNGQFYLGYI